MLCPFENDIKVIYDIIKTSHYIILRVCVRIKKVCVFFYHHTNTNIQQPLATYVYALLILLRKILVWLLVWNLIR